MGETILSIHDGHTATAAIIENGRILACLSEERLNRIKEWGGVPRLAVREVLKIAGKSPEDIDYVVVPSYINPVTSMEAGRKSIPRRIFGIVTRFVPRELLRSNIWVKPAVALLKKFRRTQEILNCIREIGIDADIEFCEHHLAHAATAFYTKWFKSDETLVITADGSGDAVSGTISIGKDYEIQRFVEVSNYNSIGELYSRVTEFLGMKPLSHEYKVMGLAPYAKEKYTQGTYEKFKRMIRISPKNPLVYENISGAWKWQYLDLFRKVLDRERFDNIAGGLQRFFEELLCRWIRNAIEETGINDIVLAGGVFMNVKANQKILHMDEVNNFFVFPSCGDESLAIGAGLLKYVEICLDSGKKPKPEPLGPIYFGPEYKEEDIENSLRAINARKKYNVEKVKDIDKFVGEMVAEGKVVARFSGRCEWGARALGNRSILADARNTDVIRKINEAVKMRDFWMPFAPSILKEREKDYLVNPKEFKAPYMIISFDTTEHGRKTLKAAIHQYDFTARPQVVEKSWNPGYYKVLKTFEKETGEGGFLNTSFNLHGQPIVCSPMDALWTLENTGLENLALGEFFISKK